MSWNLSDLVSGVDRQVGAMSPTTWLVVGAVLIVVGLITMRGLGIRR